MSNITEAFTRNSFVDKCMKLIPDDPLTQAQYIYYLTVFVFLGLLGYAVMAWIGVFIAFRFSTLFQGIFMLAISLISLFGLKQSRNSYIMTKELYKQKSNQSPVDTIEQMQKLFGEENKNTEGENAKVSD